METEPQEQVTPEETGQPQIPGIEPQAEAPVHDEPAQTPEPQGESTDDDFRSNVLDQAANDYGFSRSVLEDLPTEKIERLMADFDQALISGVTPAGMSHAYGMPGAQATPAPQQQQQQPTPPPQPTQEPAQASQWDNELVKQWNDEDAVDPIVGKSMQMMHGGMQQMAQMYMQLANNLVEMQWDQAVDALGSQEYGVSAKGLSPQQQYQRDQLRQNRDTLVGQYSSRGIVVPAIPNLVTRLARISKRESNGKLDLARQRNGQITGGPTRSVPPEGQTAFQTINQKLAEAGLPTEDRYQSERDQFL